MIVPGFIINRGDSNRSLSLPHLGHGHRNPVPSECQGDRPYSSPPAVTHDNTCTGNMFNNRVVPTDCCHLCCELEEKCCHLSVNEENRGSCIKNHEHQINICEKCKGSQQQAQDIEKTDIQLLKAMKIDSGIVFPKETKFAERETRLRATSVDSINNFCDNKISFLEAAAMKSSRSFHLFRDHFMIADFGHLTCSQEIPLLEYSGSKTNVSGSTFRHETTGFDNPTYVQDIISYGVHDIPYSPTPMKKLKQSLESVHGFNEYNPPRASSVESILSIGSIVVPGVVKTGSLESLLKGDGNVQLQYINFQDSPQHCASLNNKQKELLLEDIEDMEVDELEPYHASPKRKSQSQGRLHKCNWTNQSKTYLHNVDRHNNQSGDSLLNHSSQSSKSQSQLQREVPVGNLLALNDSLPSQKEVAVGNLLNDSCSTDECHRCLQKYTHPCNDNSVRFLETGSAQYNSQRTQDSSKEGHETSAVQIQSIERKMPKTPKKVSI